jgi:predicted acetyltransferase/predicted GNAT family acetyltransferase
MEGGMRNDLNEFLLQTGSQGWPARIELRECSTRDGYDILDMLHEIGPGENGFQNSAYNTKTEDFKDQLSRWIDMSRGIGLKPGYVPETIYWLFVDGRPVGMAKLRKYLNDKLRSLGGHTGYCIRPSERGKGYGTLLFGEVLKKAAEINIPRVLVMCREDNAASRRVIENNRGVLQKIVDGICHYWVRLDKDTGMREIHPDDYAEMVELWKNTPGVGISETDTESDILKFLLRNPGLSWCYKAGGRIVGTSLCGHDGRRGYIYHTAVLPEYRGRGIGAMLVQKNLQQLKLAGIGKCHLFVFADNRPGQDFWCATGWTRRGDICVYSQSID